MSDRPFVLVSNDDGYDSAFMRILVDTLCEHYDVCAAVPLREQSWIGKAVSRHRDVAVRKDASFPCDCWVIDGTPTDCVNIALSHLLSRKPDIVVSGVNIGYNASLHLITSSGTVSAALEGAFWGLRAIALSQCVPFEEFAGIVADRSRVNSRWDRQLRAVGMRTVGFIDSMLSDADRHKKFRPGVVNVNFPVHVDADTLVDRTYPALARSAPLFAEAEVGSGVYRFRYNAGEPVGDNGKSDLNSLEMGRISYSTIDYSLFSNDSD